LGMVKDVFSQKTLFGRHTFPPRLDQGLVGGKIMNKIEASVIVGNVWTKTYRADGRLNEALRIAGISPAEFKRLAAEVRRVEVRRHGLCILTPSGRGRR